jgi:hypothetical protein
MRYSRDQEEAMLQVLEGTVWGDIERSLAVVDEALAITMRATRDDFTFWEEHAQAAGYADEFSVDGIEDLPDRWRFATVARLIRSIALAYGVGTDLGRDEVGTITQAPDALATPLRELVNAAAPTHPTG